MKKISILGCGWLGLPLAKSLVEKGFSIKGSTTTVDKILVLKEAKIEPYLVILSEVETLTDTINYFLENSEILIINIPPKLRSGKSENFVQKIKNLIPFIEKSSIAKVIFVSSTSVYSDVTSTALSVTSATSFMVTELTQLQPETESGKQLLETEQLLQNNTNFQTTVIRFGGLIGNDRHPIHFLAGRKNIENPDAPINLIHLDDCIGIIESLITKEIVHAQFETKFWNETFNAVSPFHPSRKDYYTRKAVALNLEIPAFEEGKTSIGKLISGDKVERILGYTFQKNEL